MWNINQKQALIVLFFHNSKSMCDSTEESFRIGRKPGITVVFSIAIDATKIAQCMVVNQQFKAIIRARCPNRLMPNENHISKLVDEICKKMRRLPSKPN